MQLPGVLRVPDGLAVLVQRGVRIEVVLLVCHGTVPPALHLLPKRRRLLLLLLLLHERELALAEVKLLLLGHLRVAELHHVARLDDGQVRADHHLRQRHVHPVVLLLLPEPADDEVGQNVGEGGGHGQQPEGGAERDGQRGVVELARLPVQHANEVQPPRRPVHEDVLKGGLGPVADGPRGAVRPVLLGQDARGAQQPVPRPARDGRLRPIRDQRQAVLQRQQPRVRHHRLPPIRHLRRRDHLDLVELVVLEHFPILIVGEERAEDDLRPHVANGLRPAVCDVYFI
mmetsp:Transcript_20423/g.44680  ORF Transcript_20423/g.44680 Transcript_20423/m.44680 type:complete len:286 (+) Transcript_20423:155-1012(+)